MRNFGYLDNPTDSDALYAEDAITDAIKLTQRYAALNETGILDDNTIQVCQYIIFNYSNSALLIFYV